jgi:morphogenetic protein associated with SpoVID
MVKSGDSMYTIAQKHGIDLDQLISFNPQISNPDQLDVGMKVKIPTAVVHDGNSSGEHVEKHVVVQGDSLWKISKAWGLSLKEMVDANPQLKNPSVLLTGEVVNIPIQTAPEVNSSMMIPSNDYANMSGLGNSGALSPIMNTLSPENVSQLTDNLPQLMPEAVNQMPVSSPVNLPEAPQLQQISPLAEHQPPKDQTESKNESLEFYSTSTNLFEQFNVPAMEVQAKPEQVESFQMPEFTEMPEWGNSSPYANEQYMPNPYAQQPMASPYAQQPMASPYDYDQTMTSPYSSYSAPKVKADCGCGCGGQINPGATMQYQPPYPPLPNYVMPYSAPQPMQPMMPYSMQQPMQEQQPMQVQQPNKMEYPQWNPYTANSAFSPANMMYPTAQSPSYLYGYMSPCYPIFPPAQMSYLHGMQDPYSSWPEPGPISPSYQNVDERVEDPSSEEQDKDISKESKLEVSSKKLKVPRKSSKNPPLPLDDRTILHNFLQQKASVGDSYRESKPNEPWMSR